MLNTYKVFVDVVAKEEKGSLWDRKGDIISRNCFDLEAAFLLFLSIFLSTGTGVLPVGGRKPQASMITGSFFRWGRTRCCADC
ncbi:hypothetical protein SDJN02_02481, partial [Cucurbita argyrosperma subsp. argyrosperma]